MNTYITTNIINIQTVASFRKRIESGPWNDGLNTNNHIDRNTKNNQELEYGEDFLYIRNTILNELYSDKQFQKLVCPKQSSNGLITKTTIGGYYKIHSDSGMNGQYSTTVFLSDPSEYDGGELVLYINQQEIPFKLPAGYAVTYPSGTPHRVNEVTRGIRYVYACWTFSMFNDPFIRELYAILFKAHELLPNKVHENFTESSNDPKFLLQESINMLQRRFPIN